MVSEGDEGCGEDGKDEFGENDVVVEGNDGLGARREELRLRGVFGVKVFNDVGRLSDDLSSVRVVESRDSVVVATIGLLASGSSTKFLQGLFDFLELDEDGFVRDALVVKSNSRYKVSSNDWKFKLSYSLGLEGARRPDIVTSLVGSGIVESESHVVEKIRLSK